jgi:choline monooxygenase
MGRTDLTRELERFDVTLPLEKARTPPASWYLSQTIFERELESVFQKQWQYVANLSDLQQKGDYVAAMLGKNPVVAVCDGSKVRVLHNVCRHHAACVAEGKGSQDELVCPYHGWTYALDGALKRAPRIAGMADFSRPELSLPSLGSLKFGPLLFANSDETDGQSWLDEKQGLLSQLEAWNWQNLKHVSTKTYEIECNWKVFVDNYLDGGYHVSLLHKDLAGQLDLKDYENENGKGYTVQSCGSANKSEGLVEEGEPTGLDFSARIGPGALYAWLYPNLMINRYGPMMDTNLVVPVAPDRCEVQYHYFVDPDVQNLDSDFVERSLAASDQVQLEDTSICESVQRGMKSSSYEQGYYAPNLESGAHLFHRWLTADLRQGDQVPNSK